MGVGYMREFNVERHYRDIRVTISMKYQPAPNVAATGKLLVMPWMDCWTNGRLWMLGATRQPQGALMKYATVQLTTDALKDKERQ